MDHWADTHSIPRLRRATTDPPINTHISVTANPLVGGDSQPTTSDEQHSQRVPATEQQEQPRQYFTDTSDETHGPPGQAQPAAEPKNRLIHCAKSVSGDFERPKARLVTRGDKQDRDIHTNDVSASTASSMSTSDVIASAFLHADMKVDGEEVSSTVETTTCDHDAGGTNDDAGGTNDIHPRTIAEFDPELRYPWVPLEPNPDPTAESDPEPRESDPEYFNIINMYVTVTHITTGITSNFWSIVGGQHNKDMVSTFDSSTLCTTATLMMGSSSDHTPEILKKFDSLGQAISWQDKLHASLRYNGWRLHAFTRAPALELTGHCWTRPRPQGHSPNDPLMQAGRAHTPAPEVEHSTCTHDSYGMPCASPLESDSDDDHLPDLKGECDSDYDYDDVLPPLIDSDDDEPPTLIRGGYDSDDDELDPPTGGEYDGTSNTTTIDVVVVPPPIRGAHDSVTIATDSPIRGARDPVTSATDPQLKVTRSPFNPCHIIWDCAAGSNTCNNANIATNIKPCKTAAMAGIVPGTKVEYTQDCTMLDPAFGRCPLLVGSTANILSQAVVLDAGFRVQYTGDKFIVSHPTREDVRYVFGRSTGTHGSTKHYLMDCRTMLPPMSARISTQTLMGYDLGVNTARHTMNYVVKIKTEDHANGPNHTNASVGDHTYHALKGATMQPRAMGSYTAPIRTDNTTAMKPDLVSNMSAAQPITATITEDEMHTVMAAQRGHLVKEEWKAPTMTLEPAANKHIVQWGAMVVNRRVDTHTPVGLKWPEPPRHIFPGKQAEPDIEPTSTILEPHVHRLNSYNKRATKDVMVKLGDTHTRGATEEVKPREQDNHLHASVTTNDEPEEVEGIKHSVGSMSKSPDYPHWFSISEGAQHANTRGRKFTIIPEAFDGTAEMRREETTVRP